MIPFSGNIYRNIPKMGLYKKTCSGDTQNKKNEYLRRKFFCIDPFFLFWRHLTASKVSGEKIFCYRPTHQKTSIFQIYLMYGSDYYLEVLEPQNSRNGQNAFRKLFVGECWYSLKKWLGNREERTRCSRQPGLARQDLLRTWMARVGDPSLYHIWYPLL